MFFSDYIFSYIFSFISPSAIQPFFLISSDTANVTAAGSRKCINKINKSAMALPIPPSVMDAYAANWPTNPADPIPEPTGVLVIPRTADAIGPRTALEIIAGDAGGSEGVGVCAVGGEHIESVVAVGHVKHLVLKEVGHTGGSIYAAPVNAEAPVGSAVIGGKDRVAGGKAFFGDHAQFKAVWKLRGLKFFSYIGVITALHHLSPHPQDP